MADCNIPSSSKGVTNVSRRKSIWLQIEKIPPRLGLSKRYCEKVASKQADMKYAQICSASRFDQIVTIFVYASFSLSDCPFISCRDMSNLI